MPDETLRWIIEEAGPALTGQATQKARTQARMASGNNSALRTRIGKACLLHPSLAARWAGDWTGLQRWFTVKHGLCFGRRFESGWLLLRRDTCAALELHNDTRQWTVEKGQAAGARELRRIFAQCWRHRTRTLGRTRSCP